MCTICAAAHVWLQTTHLQAPGIRITFDFRCEKTVADLAKKVFQIPVSSLGLSPSAMTWSQENTFLREVELSDKESNERAWWTHLIT